MFYFFFESRGNKSNDPVVLWMTGGPGCSSELAVFAENGPFKIDNKTLELSWNPYGWDKVSGLVFSVWVGDGLFLGIPIVEGLMSSLGLVHGAVLSHFGIVKGPKPDLSASNNFVSLICIVV